MLSDSELIEELNIRIAETRRAMQELSDANSDLLKVNELLRESESLKSNFLSNIRNEINNPLNVIMGVASQIRTELGDGSPLCGLADTILHESQDLNFQLGNIIAAAELESGNCTAETGQVDVIALFKGILETFAPHIMEKQLSFKWENDADTVMFITDAPKLGLIFSNILDNAVKFSDIGGSICISVKYDANNLTVAVSDSGIGIAPGDLDRIYDRFLQLDSGSTRAHKGYGLGLSIVKAVLDLLNGSIRVESSPGTLTTFTFTLPTLELPDSIDIFADDGNLMIFDQTRKI